MIALPCLLLTTSGVTAQLLDDTWRVTVNGQTVKVDPDGTFVIPNISAPDSFGADGPGSRPDFISDDFVRLVGVSMATGTARYVFTLPFQIVQGETIFIADEDLIFTDTPPLFPVSIMAAADSPVITALGGTSPIVVTATLADGSQMDVSPQSAWTSYRTSNMDIANVDGNGVVTGVSEGIAFITAINEGATSTVRVTVSPGDLLSTVEGLVFFDDRSPAVGADVSLPEQGLMTTVDASGRFEFMDVATGLSDTISISVSIQTTDLFVGGATGIVPFPGGITDAGIITLASSGGSDTDGDSDGVPDAVEIAMGTDPTNPDSDDDGIPDGEEDLEADGLPDWVEFVLGTDPNLADSDGDGTDDVDEDSDGDALTDGDEVVLGTDFNAADSDGDGFGDGDEVGAGSDPTNAGSVPIFAGISDAVRYRYLNPSAEGGISISSAVSPTIRYRYLNLAEGGIDLGNTVSTTVRYRYLNPAAGGGIDINTAISGTVIYRKP
jgi:hypothetical protein